jgi:hypothetical protein
LCLILSISKYILQQHTMAQLSNNHLSYLRDCGFKCRHKHRLSLLRIFEGFLKPSRQIPSNTLN